jgi:5-methylcytosine-specific restriction enzyme subunit McrC
MIRLSSSRRSDATLAPQTERVDIHEITEWGRLDIDDAGPPSAEDQNLAAQLRGQGDEIGGTEGSKLLLDWSYDGRLRVRARSWVGVVRIAGHEIRVVPKHARGSLGVLTMLRYSSGAIPDRLRSARTLREGDRNLLDLVCLLLADEAEIVVRQGALQDYVEHEDALPALRGRLLADRQARARYGQLEQIECRFDELETDIAENRILAAGLAVAGRVCADVVIRARIRRLAEAFAELCSVTQGAADAAEPTEYTRRNKHYAAGHVWARLLLAQHGIHDLYASGTPPTEAFLLDMNVLFERFIAQALEDSAHGTPFRVDRQSSTGSIIVDALTGRTYMRVRPDVLVHHIEREETYPVDTKYKLYDERHFAPEDIYQAFLYAFAFHPGHGPRQASLVYPSDCSEVNQRLAVRGSGVTQATIRGVRVNLAELVGRAAVGRITDPGLLMLCAGCGEGAADRSTAAL